MCRILYFVPLVLEKFVLASESLFWLANGLRSTCLLIKKHNICVPSKGKDRHKLNYAPSPCTIYETYLNPVLFFCFECSKFAPKCTCRKDRWWFMAMEKCHQFQNSLLNTKNDYLRRQAKIEIRTICSRKYLCLP